MAIVSQDSHGLDKKSIPKYHYKGKKGKGKQMVKGGGMGVQKNRAINVKSRHVPLNTLNAGVPIFQRVRALAVLREPLDERKTMRPAAYL